MLRLEKIHGQNVWDILKLKVAENQRHFVSSNDRSIIEAYTTIAGNGYVGTDDYWDDAPPVAADNYNLWRLMIDEKYQNKGYGREAVRLALEFIRTLPCGNAEYCWLSYEPENDVARHLYHSFGFVETGEKDCNELIAVLKL